MHKAVKSEGGGGMEFVGLVTVISGGVMGWNGVGGEGCRDGEFAMG